MRSGRRSAWRAACDPGQCLGHRASRLHQNCCDSTGHRVPQVPHAQAGHDSGTSFIALGVTCVKPLAQGLACGECSIKGSIVFMETSSLHVGCGQRGHGKVNI